MLFLQKMKKMNTTNDIIFTQLVMGSSLKTNVHGRAAFLRAKRRVAPHRRLRAYRSMLGSLLFAFIECADVCT